MSPATACYIWWQVMMEATLRDLMPWLRPTERKDHQE